MNVILKSALVVMAVMPGALKAQQRGPFTITGNIAKLNAPAKVFLLYGDSGKVKRDSVVLQNGAFTLKGTIGSPTLANLIVDASGQGLRGVHRSDVATLYLEQGTVHVTTPDSARNIVLSGTRLNSDLQVLHSATNKSEDEVMAATKDKSDNEKEEAFTTARKAVRKKFIAEHPSSIISLAVVKNYSGDFIDGAEVTPIFALLSDSLKNSAEGKEFGDMLKELQKVAMGATAPDFTQNDTADKPVSLHNFRGKYVLVDFWASWCGPCRADNPNVVKAYEQFKTKNFTILSISLDRPGQKAAWLGAIQADHLAEWTHVSDLKFWQNDVARLYSVQAIPQNLLLDPQGKIIAKNLHGEELVDKLKSLNL